MRAAILIFALISGCATPADYVKVQWHRTNNAFAEARRLGLNVVPDQIHIRGFKYFDGEVCHVFAPDPPVQIEDGKRTYRDGQWGTLGHEVKHCFDKQFHD